MFRFDNEFCKFSWEYMENVWQILLWIIRTIFWYHCRSNRNSFVLWKGNPSNEVSIKCIHMPGTWKNYAIKIMSPFSAFSLRSVHWLVRSLAACSLLKSLERCDMIIPQLLIIIITFMTHWISFIMAILSQYRDFQ